MMAVVAVVLAAVTACCPTRFLDDDELLLNRVHVRADGKDVDVDKLNGYVRQHPNSRWFSLFKVPLGIYCISSTDSTRRVNRFFRRIGEAPVVYDSLAAARAATDMEDATRNMGYLNAQVDLEPRIHKQKIDLTFRIHPGQPYTVDTLSQIIDDPQLDSLIRADAANSLLHEGMVFDINILDQERARIASLLQNNGFYRFTKSHIRYEADTTLGNRRVELAMIIPLYRESQNQPLQPHPRYHLGSVNYVINDSLAQPGRRMPLTYNFLLSKSNLRPGALYRENDVQSTYAALAQLSAVVGTNVALEPSPTDSSMLDATVNLLMARRHNVSAELEGTNSAGDLGAAVSLGYENRNLFRRSTLLGLKVRGAFEAIKGLDGYADQNYIEYSAEANLHFPEFVFPFLTRAFRRSSKAQSIASLMFDSQDRPEFHRRVLTAAWRYRWSRLDSRMQHRIDAIDLNYVFMPWISETFRREYLSDNSSRNAVLRYNYENLFIMRWGYQFQYTSIPVTSQNATYGSNAYSIRFGIETAGNLLYGISHLFDTQYSTELDAYTLFNIAYAQYVKGDFDFSKSFRFDARNSLALHLAAGVAFPYGNSTILPYEKRYFSGGANSVRGWAVRGLGPGSFSGSDGRVDFIRQTGDVKLDLSAEWRTHLFWKIDGAAFIDAGNVWTIREYDEQPGGQFRIDTFWRQIAVAYGLGVRLNFGYFILRLDAGMKAINPAVESGRDHYPIIHPNFKRDFHLHFAVGLPY